MTNGQRNGSKTKESVISVWVHTNHATITCFRVCGRTPKNFSKEEKNKIYRDGEGLNSGVRAVIRDEDGGSNKVFIH